MIRAAQVLLVLSAAGLWVASRLTWVAVQSSDGLGLPKTSILTGASWSNALQPLAILLLVAAVAGLAVRGWLLRALAVLLAAATLVLGYLGISLIVIPDVGPRGAELAGVSVISLVGTERHYGGAIVTLVAATAALLAAVLLMRSAASLQHPDVRYAAPGARRAAVRGAEADPAASERGMWDALDDGRDPTQQHVDGGTHDPANSDTEGR